MSGPRDIGGTGFTSLADYVGANQGVLDAGYAQDSAKAHQIGDTLQSTLQPIEDSALQQASDGAPGDRSGIDGMNSAMMLADTARDQGRKLGSEAGLAGSGANPTSGEQSFNAALAYGAHGGDYRTLGEWLQGLAVAPENAYRRGTQEGLGISSQPKPSEARHDRPGGRGVYPPTPPDPNQEPREPGPGDYSTDPSIYGGGGG